MPRTYCRTVADAVAAVRARPRGRPRKEAFPAARFAPISLADAVSGRHDAASFACAFELSFPDGLILRVSREADPAALDRLVRQLRRLGE